MYSFNHITPTAEQWQAIEGTYDNTVYKSREWFAFLKSLGIKPFICEVYNDGCLAGWFVGEKVRRVFNLIGAPIEGVGTAHQGLAMLKETAAAERIDIYDQLAAWVFRCNMAVWFQVEDHCITEDDLSGTATLYEPHDRNAVDLTIDEQSLFHNLSQKSCRYMIGKARREGITIREAADPMAFVDLHYRQHLAIMRGKGMDALKPKSFYHKLVETASSSLLLLEGIDTYGTVVGTGIYAVGHGSSCYFSAAFDKNSGTSPNELMNWEAMLLCKARGARFFDLNGVDHWKFKYGGTYYRQPRLVYTKWQWLVNARREASRLYHKYRYKIVKFCN